MMILFYLYISLNLYYVRHCSFMYRENSDTCEIIIIDNIEPIVTQKTNVFAFIVWVF